MGNAMRSTQTDRKVASILTIGVLLLSMLVPMVAAVTPPPVGGTYMNDEGVLHSDTYSLYPYEEKSLSIGFSKYGELIDDDAGVGLKYSGYEVFANPAVEKYKWSNGWIISIHYTDQNYLKNVWAYALFSDNSGPSGIDGNWRQMQKSVDASAVGDAHGGRRTNGWAETDDIRLIYDGPRKAIYLLKTTIYDKDPAQMGKPLVEITIQLVFNKVKKYVMEIKDIKRIDDNKFEGPFQIEFSQRGEWDIGMESNNEAWAEFYNGLDTEYWKHPFYWPEAYVSDNCGYQPMPVTFDLCQMIDKNKKMVGFAAYWPNLISKWVTNVDSLTPVGGDDVPGKLVTMETEEKYITVPNALPPYVLWPNYLKIVGNNDLSIEIMDPLVCYPRGAGEWSEEPWVFKKDYTGKFAKLIKGIHWTWQAPYVIINRDYWLPSSEFCLVYKREMTGHEEHIPTPLDCMTTEFIADPKTYGMLAEPKVPYVFAEWDFDLDYEHPENSTHQFRCVSVYGLTDYNNAVDPNMRPSPTAPPANQYRIDKEAMYQLNEVFNPWDLKDAANKDTFRWAQKGPIATTITLDAHLHDKYDNDRTCLEGQHEVCVPEKWGYYCDDSEKVILYDADNVKPDKLLKRPTDYTISGDTITITASTSDYEYYKVLYSTKLMNPDSTWHTGRWEWIVVGEPSLASDSIGTGMIAAAWSDWKNKETWLSGLDIQAEDFGPTMPYTMRRFTDGLEGRLDFHYDHEGGDLRSAFKDDWCTPDGYEGESTIYPYAISSSNIIVVGGPLANLAAEYFNDFTDALVFTEYGDGFYAPGCWARTAQDHWQNKAMVDVVGDKLWYDSTTVDDDVGYAIISTYKDLNETVGFIVYGYTAEDTYYASYALRGGGLPWLQLIQEGVTTVLLEIDYSDLHPVAFHVREFLGPFTECTGAYTNFKTDDYYSNVNCGTDTIEQEAAELGLCYKLVDIGFCGQVHPDP